MSAVIDLASRRRPTAPVVPCCPRHVLDDLADHIAARLDEHDALLIPRDVLTESLADLRATIERLLPRAEVMP